ncbi:hypothetical protein H0H92_005353 [Tricholoma furcatifolium]|nr:hypothetical protein H0H92_005353 [Tricholoma furcatifolium]
MSWTPARTLDETEALLCAPGHIHEVTTIFLDGRSQRIYKNLWPTVRSFWITSVETFKIRTCIVFEKKRYTYNEVHQRAIKVAALYRHVYGINKGDRVGICSRNHPDYLISFWAAQLLGAVPVLTNAWLPLQPLRHCLSYTECKLIMLDPERADRLAPAVFELLRETPVKGFLVFDDGESNQQWQGMSSFSRAVQGYSGDTSDILAVDPCILPEDNAAIMFTSGTTGLPKGVLSTQRQFLSNIPNRQVMVGAMRASLRRGEQYPQIDTSNDLQKGLLIAVPLFHVTGTTSFTRQMMATATGMKIVLASKWVVEDAITYNSVPAMVADLVESSLAGYSLDGLLFGGSPAPDSLVPKARKAFPTAIILLAKIILLDLPARQSSASLVCPTKSVSLSGRASPVNEIKIIHDGTTVPPGRVGEVWLYTTDAMIRRGPNVMKGYWRDPVATAKVITPDGWLKTGDLGFLDEEGFLYIKDRLKDIIIRGGENIDSVSVENALYQDSRILEAAAVSVPDERLGELVAAVVSIKPAYQGSVTEDSLITMARNYLPKFAVPVMIVVLDEPLEHTPSGKIIKGELRRIARAQWEIRRRNGTAREPLANL